MGKAEYGRYRREVFSAGSPPLITKYIAQGKIAAPALQLDGRIDRALADVQLAVVLDRSRQMGRPPAAPPDLAARPEEDDEEFSPPDTASQAASGYAAAQTALLDRGPQAQGGTGGRGARGPAGR